MKKTLLLLALLLGMNAVHAQVGIYGSKESKRSENPVRSKVSNRLTGKVFDNPFAEQNSFSGTIRGEETIEPIYIIDGAWSSVYNVETQKESMIKLDYESYYENYATYYESLTIRILDKNFEVEKSISFDLPEKTNFFRVEYEHNNSYFMIYAHYFEGGSGPDYQVHEMLFVDYSGNIIKRMKDRDYATLVEDILLVTDFNDYKEQYTFYLVDPVSFEERKSFTLEQNLVMNLSGAALTISEFEGDTYIVTSSYEKELMSFETYELTPDNHLILNFYDLTGELVKNTKIGIPYPEEEFGVYPMLGYGSFLPEFDITSQVFNEDNKWEFVITCYVMTFMGEWHNLYVVNEDGEYVRSYTDEISDYFFKSNIEGHDTMISMIIADEEGNQSLQFFNVESWKADLTLPAVHNGDVISVYNDRVKVGEDFEYIIGLKDIEEDVDGSLYGIIKRYDRQGNEVKKIRLPLGEMEEDDALGFQAELNIHTLNPFTFDDDDEVDYMYVRNSYKNGITIHFAKDNAKAPFFSIGGDDEGRNPNNYMISYDPETNELDKLYLTLASMSTTSKTLVYDLPFVRSVDLPNVFNDTDNLIVYPNPTTDKLYIENTQDDVRLFDINGRLLNTIKNNGKNRVEIDLTAYSKGIYLIKTSERVAKVIKQ